jgi:hypothetical protein
MGMEIRVTRIGMRVAGLLAVALITGAGGCTALGPSSGPEASDSGSPGTVVLSERGNAMVTVGDQVETPVNEGSAVVLSLTVDDIQVLESCPSRAAPTQSPTLGHFVVLAVTATLRAPETALEDLPPDEQTYAGLGAERFRIFDPAGTVQETTSTDASWACFEDSELLPAFVDVGQTVSGNVVLDSQSPHGTVVFSHDDSAGWEWTF